MTTPFLYTPTFSPVFNGQSVPNGLLYTYEAGTTNPKPTFADPAGLFPNSNPVQLDVTGAATVRLEPGAYHFVLTDSTGDTVLWDQDFYNAPYLTVEDLGALLFAQTSAELAAGITPTSLAYPAGDVRRYGFVGNGTTDNTVALQAAINANAGYTAVRIPALSTFAKLSGRITAPANTTILLDPGAELKWSSTTLTGSAWLGSATRPGIEVLGDNFTLRGGKLTGPTIGNYVANEYAIFRLGAGSGNQGTASPGSGFVVRDCEISRWGSGGIATQFVNDFDIENNNIHDCGYDAIHLLSPRNGRIWGNHVKNVTPGTSANAYGISCTHDSRNYNVDPAVTGTGAFTAVNQRQAVNPFPINVDVRGNTVENVDIWLGIDFHGGFDCTIDDNTVYNCFRGIQLSSSSGDATGFAGENNNVTNNIVIAYKIDGSATTVANGGAAGTGSQAGITVNGGTTVAHSRVHVTGNTLIGVGHKGGGSNFAIEATSMDDCVIADNIMQGCYGDAINASAFDGAIVNNLFGTPGQSSSSRAIYLQGNNGYVVLSGNRHDPHGGNVYATGADINTTLATRVVLGPNEFSQCTTPYGSNFALLTAGNSDITPRVQDTTAGSHAVDCSALGHAPRIWIDASTATATISDITGVKVGAEVVITQSANANLTVTGAPFKLGNSNSAVIPQFGSLTLQCVSTGNPKFFEKSRALTNT